MPVWKVHSLCEWAWCKAKDDAVLEPCKLGPGNPCLGVFEGNLLSQWNEEKHVAEWPFQGEEDPWAEWHQSGDIIILWQWQNTRPLKKTHDILWSTFWSLCVCLYLQTSACILSSNSLVTFKRQVYYLLKKGDVPYLKYIFMKTGDATWAHKPHYAFMINSFTP